MAKKSEKLSDGEILKRSVKEPWMFGVLVNKYQKAFLGKSMKILRSKEDAEDVVQETFLKIYKNAVKFEEVEDKNFNSWAYKILINNCYDSINRKNKNLVNILDFADLDSSGKSSLGDDYDSIEKHSLVESVLAKMPENLARLLRLYFFEEKSQKEIAEEEKISLVAVRSRIHRAKKYFKNISLQLI